MIKTITLKTDIPAYHEMHIMLPDDIPVEPTEVVIVIASENAANPQHTLSELVQSEFFGMWRDRQDIDNQFAEKLRRYGWTRTPYLR